MSPHDENKLERLVHQALHDLPPRPAPSTLEARVRAAIARRAARPWWLKGFAHWPVAARTAFAVMCLGLVAGVVIGIGRVAARVDLSPLKAVFAPEVHVATTIAHLASTGVTLVGDVIAAIPPLWLYGGAATIAALYVALFGLGAAAYRTLYASS